MALLSNLDLIRRVPLLSLLRVDHALDIAQSVVKRRYRHGETVVAQGERTGALYILLTGRARVFVADARGREVTLATLRPGDYAGEMSLLDNEPHSASVRAELTSDVLVLDGPDFARCMPAHTPMSSAILRGLAQRLRSANRRIESLALVDVSGRVARQLLDMAETEGEALVIPNRVSRLDLSKMVGASREMVSRAMSDLAARGVIQTREDGTLLIHQRLD